LIYGVQDGVAFETNLDLLVDLHQLGLRVVQPTYNRRNLLGDGCMEPANAGLSRAGVEAIERMNALNILVDLSHCGRQTSADAIRVSGSRSRSLTQAAQR
jgi:membrane dipeptidase